MSIIQFNEYAKDLNDLAVSQKKARKKAITYGVLAGIVILGYLYLLFLLLTITSGI